MTRDDLIERIAVRTKMSRTQSENLVLTIFGSMQESLRQGERWLWYIPGSQLQGIQRTKSENGNLRRGGTQASPILQGEQEPRSRCERWPGKEG